MSARPDPVVLGWREWVRLDELGVDGIKAKLDTGARTSALHAFDLEEYERDGRLWVRFEIHPVQRSAAGAVLAEAVLVGRRRVRSSTGHAQTRPVIRTILTLDSRSWPIQVTLTRRDEMGFRLLLGRQALRRRVLVDPAVSYRSVRPLA